jgi:hypothetical protein
LGGGGGGCRGDDTAQVYFGGKGGDGVAIIRYVPLKS